MTQTITVRTGTDSEVTLSLDEAYADKLVQATVQTIPESTQEERLRFIEHTAGKWEGEMERPLEGECEQRDEL